VYVLPLPRCIVVTFYPSPSSLHFCNTLCMYAETSRKTLAISTAAPTGLPSEVRADNVCVTNTPPPPPCWLQMSPASNACAFEANACACRYSVRYRAVFRPSVAGAHTFSITHKESAKLWVDGVSLIDSTSSGGASVTVSGTINLPLTNA